MCDFGTLLVPCGMVGSPKAEVNTRLPIIGLMYRRGLAQKFKIGG
jgi:hypothetical protein